jgi:Predicted aminopeptidases
MNTVGTDKRGGGRRRRRWTSAPLAAVTATVLAGSVAIPAGTAMAAVASPAITAAATTRSSLADHLEHRVTGAKVFQHLRALQRIADANGGVRATDTPGYTASANYVATRLRRAGYQVTRQQVPYTDAAFDAETARETSPSTQDINVLMMRFSPSGPAGGITADVVAPPTERDGVLIADPGCTPESYDGLDAAGKIVVVPRAACGFDVQQEVAASLGAVAFVTYLVTPSPDNIWRLFVFEPDRFHIPSATVSQSQGEALAAAASHGPVRLALDLRAHLIHRTTENIIAETTGGRADHVVMAGAHLDSVSEGPGIDDNASSAAALLEIAEDIAPMQSKLVNKVRFAFWGAEELVDVGSGFYVEQLSQQERGAIAYYLNSELIAAPNFATFVVHVPGGSAADQRVENEYAGYFTRRGLPFERQDNVVVGSDDEAFSAVGIPIGGVNGAQFSAKSPAEAAVFGGTAGQLFDHCYHQACDRLDDLNATALDRHARATAWVVGDLAVHG